MSLIKFSEKLNDLPFVSDVTYNEEENKINVICTSNPKNHADKISNIRKDYTKISQISEKKDEENNTILVYST